jgi:hypothetical protein
MLFPLAWSGCAAAAGTSRSVRRRSRKRDIAQVYSSSGAVGHWAAAMPGPSSCRA